MKPTKTYLMPLRRRKEGKTNYRKRLAVVKSEKKRLVVRKSNKASIVQVISYEERGDITIASAHTKELTKYGWKGSIGNVPAAYLAGYLCGIKAKSKNVGEAIFDIGLQTAKPGSKIYAALKGAVDAGLKVAASEEVFPKEDRIKGRHIKEDIAMMFDNVKQKMSNGVLTESQIPKEAGN